MAALLRPAAEAAAALPRGAEARLAALLQAGGRQQRLRGSAQIRAGTFSALARFSSSVGGWEGPPALLMVDARSDARKEEWPAPQREDPWCSGSRAPAWGESGCLKKSRAARNTATGADVRPSEGSCDSGKSCVEGQVGMAG